MRALLLVSLLLGPLLAAAAGIPAGFPSSALWLSKTSPTHGDAVTIYTVVYNSSESTLSGSVVFLVDGTTLGSKPFSMAPGTNDIVSHAWTAKEGSHTFSARLDGVSGSEDSLESTITATTTITVLPPPPPPPAVTEATEAAEAVTASVQEVTPVITSIASTTFNTAEGVRESAVRALERLASSTTQEEKPEGEVLGAEDYEAQMEANATKSFDIGATIQNIWQAFLNVLLMIFRSSFWFYVFVAAVIFMLVAFVRTVVSDRRSAR